MGNSPTATTNEGESPSLFFKTHLSNEVRFSYLVCAPTSGIKENSAHSGIRPEIHDFTHFNLNVQIANEVKLNLFSD